MDNIEKLCVGKMSTLRQVLESIEATRRGIALVVDEDKHLLGVVTDGDCRRAILKGKTLSSMVGCILDERDKDSSPISATTEASHTELVSIIKDTKVSHIPIVDKNGCIVQLVCLDDLLEEDELALQAIVMAGGKGTRLHPLTKDMPKPMLPIGDKPIMERIIKQLRDTGVRQVRVTTHHLPEKISDHFGDGKRFGVDLTYVSEDQQLGTAGGLSMLDKPDTTVLVINGDILTEVDFKAMLSFHQHNQAVMTMAVRQYEIVVPYGVVETNGVYVSNVNEKPTQRYFVNAGIYLLEPLAVSKIPKGCHFDMTELAQLLIAEDYQVASFPIWEYWCDIGQHDDYAKAQNDVINGKVGRGIDV